MLIKDPMIAVCLPKDRQVRQVFKKTLYKEEVGEIVRYAKRYPGAFVFVFAIFTGLRQGEILALTHRDVRNNMIHVSKTLHYIKAEGKYSLVISPAKTRQSNRVIPLCESLIPMLDAHIELEKGKHLKHGKLFTADAPLFSTAGCDYNSGRNLRGKLRRMYKILGIEPTNFHGLRHTFCSALARNGVNIKTASELMGHASTETTLGIYTHVFEDEKVRGVASLANEFPE
jgi:integrase